ncbi:hypothetical protein D3C72_999420 [compost metagenome]
MLYRLKAHMYAVPINIIVVFDRFSQKIPILFIQVKDEEITDSIILIKQVSIVKR